MFAIAIVAVVILVLTPSVETVGATDLRSNQDVVLSSVMHKGHEIVCVTPNQPDDAFSCVVLP